MNDIAWKITISSSCLKQHLSQTSVWGAAYAFDGFDEDNITRSLLKTTISSPFFILRLYFCLVMLSNNGWLSNSMMGQK